MHGRQERGLDAVRGVDLGLDALALDDALHVRREVVVAVRDAALRREARRREEGDAREREREREKRARARGRGGDGDERKQADEQPAPERGGRRREEVGSREDEEDGRDPAEAHGERRPQRPDGRRDDAHEEAERGREGDAEREEALAVEGREKKEETDAREEERVERRGEDGQRRGPRPHSAPRSDPVPSRAQTAPDFSGSAGRRSAAAATAGDARRPERSEPPTVAFTGSRRRMASNDASRSPQRSRAKLSPTDQARKTRTESGMS